MNIFFAGNPFGDSGPRIVNRNLIRCIKDEVSFITMRNKLLRFVEVIWKTLRCRLIIFSGVTSYDHVILPICRALKKKIVFIMHGYLEYEDKINRYSNPGGERNEALLLKHSDLILCVSETYMHFIKRCFPQYSDKLSFLTNGIDWEMLDNIRQTDIQRNNRRIVLIGGGRITKKNLEVCKAVDLLNQKNQENFFVEVYGDFLENDLSRDISRMANTVFHPIVPHDKLLEVFGSAFLFVQNSDFEPFSLGVVEALVCGCDILISRNVGAIDILTGLTDNDLISNTSDIEQIAEKIYFISSNSNNQRLLSSIDRDETSIQSSARKLLQLTHSLI